MIRVTKWISELWKMDDAAFEAYLDQMSEKHNKKKKLTPKQVLYWSSDFGTKMHSWCLEGEEPKQTTKAMQSCHYHWQQFIKENDIKLLKTERKVMYKNAYHGTYDAIVEWDGMKVLLDLKFWKCWYWALLKEEIPEELKMSSTKLAKANFQTYCYNKAQKDYETDARCVVAINPLGLQFKVFRTSPKKKFDAEIQILLEQNANDF